MNVFFIGKLCNIGGCESFLYYLSKIYKDFVVYYELTADPLQVQRLSQNVEVRKWNKEIIKCKRLFCNYAQNMMDYCEAEEKIHIVHCDYNAVTFKPIVHPKATKYISVSKRAGQSFFEHTGIKCEVVYNIVPIEKKGLKKKEGLNLISCTRLTSEKGGWRIDKLSELLDKHKVKYTWTIYTNKNVHFKSKNVIVKQQDLNLNDEIEKSSWLVQLSDGEAYGLSVVEALILGTPVIITDLEVFKELGIEHGKNACTIDMDVKNIDYELIKNPPLVDYEEPKSTWDKYLSKKGTYNPNDLVEVRVIKRKLTDNYEGKSYLRGQTYKTPKHRASYLEALGYIERVE